LTKQLLRQGQDWEGYRIASDHRGEVSDRLSDRDRVKKLTLGYSQNFLENHDGRSNNGWIKMHLKSGIKKSVDQNAVKK
jgi:hypothetical protein